MNAAAIVADFRRAIELLAELSDPGATRTAATLSRWLAGEDFESAAGLLPHWRSHLRLTARDLALAALAAMHSDLDDSALADRILGGFDRLAGRMRPDGADGYLADLVRAGDVLSKRQWRRLIRGHRSC
jgi:hypothetical protein